MTPSRHGSLRFRYGAYGGCKTNEHIRRYAGGGGSYPRPLTTAKEPGVIMDTEFGSMEMRFFPEKAPKHVENAIKLAKELYRR